MQQRIGTEPGNGLGIAIFLAATLHAILVLGIGFDPGAEPAYTPQLEITLAQRRSELAPDEATHLAQFSQQGSGDESAEASVSSAASAPLAMPSEQQAELAPRAQPQTGTPVTTSSASPRQTPASPAASTPEAAAMPGLSPDAERLSRELANLEAALDDQARDYSNRPRVKRLTSLSTREAADAAYLHDWRRRVEAVGNQYYPEASIRYGLYGSLRLLVVINYDGRLEDIQVLASSGYAVLDEAAIKIVRMAAPFAPFPAELRTSADKLEIIRTWQFEENRLSSG
ncbi:energy transducer TonB [Haliea sp. E1-2-M8]|uniref:energy transducer TonB n=1 Tax=Haliea sp. E1-2-M8 TaxID=3064706 RepID=UPI002717DEF2|nr:energy transducer TonB [Haliea sp. E1-2-M8]MDO8860202.1 energy transducer TonB [Haliea sp. E1-2-M8]